ncbi:hypothetical protein C8Q75DRAFT_760596 [Abortiporus biennis]|nr:hypothetical protein C8Q75DRAFT_760596 [Abortiporus biennis]
MEPTSVAEQRATAVAKLKRAASLPRMKDGRRPPMHTEGVSEGEKVQADDKAGEESAESEGGKPEVVERHKGELEDTNSEEKAQVDEEGKSEEVSQPERPITPSRRRRSRSRTRSRGSKDLRRQKPTINTNLNESSADENYTSNAGEEVPPSPPLLSPVPVLYRFSGSQNPRLLRSPMTPSPLPYPVTSSPFPTLADLQKGLFRSNSAGANRAMAMQKLTGGTEPVDLSFISPSPTPPLFAGNSRLARNNTVAGGERFAARQILFNRLEKRINKDGEQTSGGEDTAASPTPASGKRRRRRSRRSSSRASTVLDEDREDRDPASTTPNTPLLPSSTLPTSFNHTPDPPWPNESPHSRLQSHQQQTHLPFDIEAPLGGRSIVVEEEDDEPQRLSPMPPSKPYPGLPVTPARTHGGSRLPHTSDAPSSTSTDSAPSSAVPVPFYISVNPSLNNHPFPASPFATPRREPFTDGDDDEVSDVYQEIRNKAASRNAIEREISWVADPVLDMSRLPMREEDDDIDDQPQAVEPIAEDIETLDENADEPLSPTSPVPQEDYIVEELETSPEPEFIPTASLPPSQSADKILPSPPNERIPTPAPPSPLTYPRRLEVATPSQLDRSPSAAEFPDGDDSRTDTTPKRGGESIWERAKGAFTRTGSSSGRRSRTNSLSARDRRYNTDSSISRESGASITSPKMERTDTFAAFPAPPQPPTPLMQSPSASASISSLAIPPVSAGGISPIPPASSADLLKYADSKLFPFPGMRQLEEQMQRNRAKLASTSSPDIVLQANGHGAAGMEVSHSSGSSSSATTRSPDTARARKLSHQMSDTLLLEKYNSSMSPAPMSAAPSTTSQNGGYFDLKPLNTTPTPPTSASNTIKLPTRRWKKLFSPSTPTTPTPTAPQISLPQPRPIAKKPSLSDLLLGRKDMDLSADWEDVGSDKSRTPTATSNAHPTGKFIFKEDLKEQQQHQQQQQANTIRADASDRVKHDAEHSNHVVDGLPRQNGIPHLQLGGTMSSSDFSGFPSPPDPPSSTTPDPQSSLDDFPTRSTSESYSAASSRDSPDPHPSNNAPSKIGLVMERLEEILGRGSKSSLWPTAIDDPPRKVLLSSPVLQVSNANTVKDRFLLLFNDMLVVAKPVVQDHEALLENAKIDPSDRKYIVKSVVPLKDMKVSGDRDESRTKSTDSSNPMRHPVIRSFLHNFAKDPDHAITVLFEKSHCRDDPVALGQLMFKATDIDRAKLGEYLARRTSKLVLKSYVDEFGFAGLRIDKALRVFLLSVSIPPTPNSLEYLLDSFAGRWYEANAGFVAYDRDLAGRLVRAIVHLNDVMHGGIAQSPGITGYPKRNVLNKDFVDAFKRIDFQKLVPDELLEKIYASVRREKLFQARNPSTQTGMPDVTIVVKRPIPARLTYRVQSEPIVLRIPQPDPQLTIQLFGQDLIFDPPVLNFAKSSEASFRITGTSLGPKSIIMWRSGPNALAYCGLPLSSSVVVERAFMRHTFQVAFPNHEGIKRKYMFSVNDAIVRHQWVISMKRQIDVVTTCSPTIAMLQSDPYVKAYQAANDIAFKVLQQTLITPDSEDNHPVDQAFARLTGSPPRSSNGIPSRRSKLDGVISHYRSKSRSQIYHRYGAGKSEPDFGTEDLDPDTSGYESNSGVGASLSRYADRLWSGHELTITCRQNGAIAAVLAYLQVANSDQQETIHSPHGIAS